MREIIYRAWYNNKELLEVDTIFFRDGKPFVYLKRGSEVFGQGGCDVVLEQFTGLVDKNGVRIFEGDIFSLGDPTILHVVEWMDTGLKGKQIRSLSYVGIEYWRDSIVVIGNIHEQKEQS